jgi:CRISPR-associated protein Cas2
MFILVSYDVVDDRKRSLLAGELLNYGRRVQKSVFECILDERRYLEMVEKVEKIIDMTLDSVRFYVICAKCRGIIKISGWGTISDTDDVIIV